MKSREIWKDLLSPDENWSDSNASCSIWAWQTQQGNPEEQKAQDQEPPSFKRQDICFPTMAQSQNVPLMSRHERAAYEAMVKKRESLIFLVVP